MPSDAECDGDGGGIGDEGRGEPGVLIGSEVGDAGDCADEADIARFDLEPPDLALVVDFMDATSDRSPLAGTAPSVPASADMDVLGLSVLPFPGIFDLIAPLMEREDSFVSVLLNDGYDCSPSPVERSTGPGDVLTDDPGPSAAAPAFFDCCCPIVSVNRSMKLSHKERA